MCHTLSVKRVLHVRRFIPEFLDKMSFKTIEEFRVALEEVREDKRDAFLMRTVEALITSRIAYEENAMKALNSMTDTFKGLNEVRMHMDELGSYARMFNEPRPAPPGTSASASASSTT